MDTLNIKQFLQYGQDRLSVEEEYTFPDIQSRGPFNCSATIRTRATGLDVAGAISGEAELPCDRCLTLMRVPVTLTFDERFVFFHDIEYGERDRERMIDDFYEEVDAEGELDLKDLMRQLILLDLAQPHICGQPNCDFGSCSDDTDSCANASHTLK